MMQHGSCLRAHPFIRIRRSQRYSEKSWLCRQLQEKTGFLCGEKVVHILVYCLVEQDYDAVVTYFSRQWNISCEQINSLVSQLLEKKLLVSAYDQDTQSLLKTQQAWYAHNWVAAFDYHYTTFNYPFLEARGDGVKQHADTMTAYSAEMPDIDRCKTYPIESVSESIQWIDPNDVAIQPSIMHALLRAPSDGSYNVAQVFDIVALTFGSLGMRRVKWCGASLLKKVVPSGGGRHPAECYLIVLDDQEMTRGVWHYCSHSNSFKCIKTLNVDFDAMLYFPTLIERASFAPKIVAVITTVFERNMYRYRESRTFRSIHMDVGHVVENMRMCADAQGMPSFMQYDANNEEVSRLLEVDPLQEGVMMSLAFGCEGRQ